VRESLENPARSSLGSERLHNTTFRFDVNAHDHLFGSSTRAFFVFA